ncbi:MAG: hypothetical protein HFK09_06085 [Clostridia bacterium]|nr:hypothetical protein [Clostridia bacterium]
MKYIHRDIELASLVAFALRARQVATFVEPNTRLAARGVRVAVYGLLG